MRLGRGQYAVARQRRAGRWVVQNDIVDFGPGTQTGVTFTSLNASNRKGTPNAAGTLLETAVTSLHVISSAGISLVAGRTYRLTTYLQPIGGRDCNFGFSGLGFGLNVTLAGPSILSAYGAVFNQSVSVSALAFVTLQFSFVANATGLFTIDIYCANPAGTVSYLGDVTKGLIIDETTVEILVP